MISSAQMMKGRENVLALSSAISNWGMGGVFALCGYFGRRLLNSWAAHETIQTEKINNLGERVSRLEGIVQGAGLI
jgi:hypothetical protein